MDSETSSVSNENASYQKKLIFKKERELGLLIWQQYDKVRFDQKGVAITWPHSWSSLFDDSKSS